ncbi:tRNA uridine-5-carboxymethylaminomethyl(34) synthesis GTPase MnmE [Haloplasma contractile]|uniref:tRNA modification GTPase MnmE n=1 Tax=Haloplasma contractile SSD-17B TaxID=1033810 RepID=F7PSX2_9MOLU|nr:tRNA uridine-5-carboxymethylaminomethyl(34) synthesis GTPase MnmE [Haloplasma contractile]ERJ12543.1 tRNA modification GTPase MnmE protein [Haloplasma contractile SSD-17B]
MFDDTIVAISTALGEGAISIVRLSGPDSIEIANKLFKGKDLMDVKSHTIHYGHIYEPETDSILDEVMLTVLKSPRTYTKEDIIEINCHGGIYITNKVLELTLTMGARLAEPGEFTKRAFLNGRIDLAQAESVMDLINAKTEESLTVAMKGVDGRVSKLVTHLREQVLQVIANIEVNIDYPEYDDAIEMSNELLKPLINNVILELNRILEVAKTGKIIREGIKTAIIGRPNVGKSSLLNKLMREERAIVTEIAGTTRDVIEGFINIGGIALKLVDTAGIRETEDLVEAIGVERSKQAISEAELVLLVLNNSEPLTEEDRLLLDLTKDKQRIILINKSDLESKIDKSKLNNFIETSMVEDIGIEDIEEKVKQLFDLGEIKTKDMTYISNTRHIAKLRIARESLENASRAIEMEVPVDMVEVDVKEAWIALGEILGKEVGDSLLDELFSKFCLGK